MYSIGLPQRSKHQYGHFRLGPFSLLVVTISMLFVSLLIPSAVHADVIHVPADYGTIQEAIDAALTGDEVRIAPGTYEGEGNLRLNFLGKDISVVSESGPAVTIIDGSNTEGPAFCIDSGESSAALIEGLTIRWCFAGPDCFGGGGGISCYHSSPTIRNCIIEYCYGWGGGGGIDWRATTPALIEDCIIRNNATGSENEGPGSGGGLSLTGPVTVSRCEIVDNRAYGGSGGGVDSFLVGGVRLEDCLIAGNAAVVDWPGQSGYGGGISGKDFTLVHCGILGNSSHQVGGGLEVWGDALIEDCLIAGNLSETAGAGIASIDQGVLTVRRSTIASNLADGRGPTAMEGGGVRADDGSQILFEQTVLWGNCSAVSADEAYVSTGCALTFDCCDVDNTHIEGNGALNYIGENLFVDPWFCGPLACESAPGQGGDYTIAENSPCIPENSPCDALIGVYGVGCGIVPVTTTITWGAMKALFREE